MLSMQHPKWSSAAKPTYVRHTAKELYEKAKLYTEQIAAISMPKTEQENRKLLTYVQSLEEIVSVMPSLKKEAVSDNVVKDKHTWEQLSDKYAEIASIGKDRYIRFQPPVSQTQTHYMDLYRNCNMHLNSIGVIVNGLQDGSLPKTKDNIQKLRDHASAVAQIMKDLSDPKQVKVVIQNIGLTKEELQTFLTLCQETAITAKKTAELATLKMNLNSNSNRN